MVKINKLTDYAVVLLSHFAQLDSGRAGRLSASELHEITLVPLPTVTKLLKLLTKAQILRSARGVRGGYSLARPATKIKLTEVIAAIEGPIAMTECLVEPGICSVEAVCPSKNRWGTINKAVSSVLDKLTIAQVAKY